MSDQAKLLRMLKCISLLGTGNGMTIDQLARHLEKGTRTVYRYIETLGYCGFIIDKDFSYGRYFIHRPVSKAYQPEFTVEEVAFIRQLAAVAKKHPLMDSILTKVFEQSELPPVNDLLLRARLLQFIAELKEAMKDRRQVVLQSYHSANSNDIKDRLVEPIALQTDFSTLLAYDTADGQSKFFKLDRMNGITVLATAQKHSHLHQNVERDIFGMAGAEVHWVRMELDLRAHTLLREEFPASAEYTLIDDSGIVFHGPVRAYEGIGRFILGLPGHIANISNPGLLAYLKGMASKVNYTGPKSVTEVVKIKT